MEIVMARGGIRRLGFGLENSMVFLPGVVVSIMNQWTDSMEQTSTLYIFSRGKSIGIRFLSRVGHYITVLIRPSIYPSHI